jgi:hypothetical protein
MMKISPIPRRAGELVLDCIHDAAPESERPMIEPAGCLNASGHPAGRYSRQGEKSPAKAVFGSDFGGDASSAIVDRLHEK